MPITKVVMPKLSEAMESGKVIKWIKKEGDRVEGGEIIAEIETDKADIELEAFGSGVLRKIVVPAGDRAPVGGLIAVIADAADDIAGLLAGAPPPPPAGAPPPPPPPAPAPSPDGPRAGSRTGGCPRRPGQGLAPGEEGRRPVGRRSPARSGKRSGRTHRPAGRRGRRDGGARSGAGGDPRGSRRRVSRRAAVLHPGRDRQADAAGQGAGPPLLRDRRDRDGPGPGAPGGAERARGAAQDLRDRHDRQGVRLSADAAPRGERLLSG